MNHKVLTSIALAAFLVACKSTPMKPADVEDKSVNTTSTATTSTTGTDSNADANANTPPTKISR